MEKEFVTYEIALALKELGFDEECFNVYDELGFIQDEKEMDKLNLIKLNAPLWQQVIDWFRENRDIDIVITPDTNSQHRIPLRKYFVTFWKYYNGLNVQPEILRYGNKILYFVNPEKAREQAILKAIELCKDKKS